jgi:hypothetical protein
MQNISQYDSGERCGPWASCYFIKFMFAGKVWCPTLVFKFYFWLEALNDTLFVDKNKIVIISFSLGKLKF